MAGMFVLLFIVALLVALGVIGSLIWAIFPTKRGAVKSVLRQEEARRREVEKYARAAEKLEAQGWKP